MKRLPLLAALVLCGLPLFAQSSEFGFTVGGGKRFVESAPPAEGSELLDEGFSLSNNSFELFWGYPTEEDVFLKFKVGRIETPVAFALEEGEETVRLDAEGEVQHASVVVEYRFSEPFGSTSLFGGLGLYRQTAPNVDAAHNFGFQAGLNADFPMTRRYGLMLESTYHWTRGDFRARYLTLGAGLRISL
jgi:hypothetical protein